MLGSLQSGLGGTAFTPTDIGSIAALYEGPGILHSGANVTGWNDSSGHAAANLGLGGAANPQYVANAGAGLPGVSFNGSSSVRFAIPKFESG